MFRIPQDKKIYIHYLAGDGWWYGWEFRKDFPEEMVPGLNLRCKTCLNLVGWLVHEGDY